MRVIQITHTPSQMVYQQATTTFNVCSASSQISQMTQQQATITTNVCKPNCSIQLMYVNLITYIRNSKSKCGNVTFVKTNFRPLHMRHTLRCNSAPNNRCKWNGKTNFPFDFHSSIFPPTQPQRFLQRESMSKSPLINNNSFIIS